MTQKLRKLEAKYRSITARWAKEIRKEAERALIEAVVRAHKANGGKYEVCACSAMGSVTLDVYGPGPSERMPEIVKRIDSYWEPSGIPAAPVIHIRMMPRQKRPIIKYDW